MHCTALHRKEQDTAQDTRPSEGNACTLGRGESAHAEGVTGVTMRWEKREKRGER